MYKLRSWIDEPKLTNELSLNPNAVEHLEEHPDKIDYYYISKNINAIHIIEKNLDKCHTETLYENPNMTNLLRNNRELLDDRNCMFRYEHCIEFIEEYVKKNELVQIDWSHVSSNSAAIHILEQYPEKIHWIEIMNNQNAKHIICNNIEKVKNNWRRGRVCAQPHLLDLIESYPEKIIWNDLSMNPNAIHLLKNNLEKIYVDNLRYNKNGFELLLQLGHRFHNNEYYNENIVLKYFDHCVLHNIKFTLIRQLCALGHTDKHFEFIKSNPIYYDELSANPNIFEYDYSRMKKTCQEQPWYQNIKNEFI